MYHDCEFLSEILIKVAGKCRNVLFTANLGDYNDADHLAAES